MRQLRPQTLVALQTFLQRHAFLSQMERPGIESQPQRTGTTATGGTSVGSHLQAMVHLTQAYSDAQVTILQQTKQLSALQDLLATLTQRQLLQSQRVPSAVRLTDSTIDQAKAALDELQQRIRAPQDVRERTSQLRATQTERDTLRQLLEVRVPGMLLPFVLLWASVRRWGRYGSTGMLPSIAHPA